MQPADPGVPPIADGLFTDETPPRLIGGRCRDTGRIVFPCPPSPRFDPLPVSREGRVWSWTVQRFRPKSPPYAGGQTFEPFILAYVELAETIVAARLTGIAPEAVRVGLPVRFAPAAFTRADGSAARVPAFEPVEAA